MTLAGQSHNDMREANTARRTRSCFTKRIRVRNFNIDRIVYTSRKYIVVSLSLNNEARKT